jgi:predicted ATPase
MFDYIKIEGFRSFKKVELEVPRLAVLIGPNGGGKSNFLDLLTLMAEAGNMQLANGVAKRGGFANIAFGFDPQVELRVEMRFKAALPAKAEGQSGDERPDVRFSMTARGLAFQAVLVHEVVAQESGKQPSLSAEMLSRGPAGAVFRVMSESGALTDKRVGVASNELAITQVRNSSEYPAAAFVLGEFTGWRVYRDIDVGSTSPVRQPALIRPGIQLLPDGSNLSSVLYAIQQDYPDDWQDVLEILRTAYPEFVKLTVPAQGGDGKVLLRWFEKPFDRHGGISANFLSDGTLKLLCLLAILKSPDPPPLICIDEPELGLHPDWIKLVAELLQVAAMRTQVIVATHSPHIVAKLEPEQVIVAEKVDGETRLERQDRQDLEKWLKDFNLSELWLAGQLGGRP